MSIDVTFKFAPGDAVNITRFDALRDKQICKRTGVVDVCYVDRSGVHHYSVLAPLLWGDPTKQPAFLESELEAFEPTEASEA